MGVTRVYTGGLTADVCVYYAAPDSLKEGFKTTLINEATQG
jgi:nicotinamidase-related amidase